VQFKILSTEKDFEQYQIGFLDEFLRLTQQTGTPIPSEYLKSSKVVGVINDAGIMVAGYILNSRQPFRLLEFVPEVPRKKLSLPDGKAWNDCVEVTCVWKLPNQVSHLFMTSRFWPRVQVEILTSGKALMLGHTQNAKLNQFYSFARPLTLYEGISTFGLPSTLFVYRRWQNVACYFALYFIETPKRAFKQWNKNGRK
jgi:hypothetical protein